MTQKTIKALYKQPVNYKLIKDGYKTIKGVINAQDGMPKILDLPTPSELYESNLVYNVDTSVNGAPIITTNSFKLPDDETCESKQYCYATKGTNYNYIMKQEVEYKYLDTATYIVNGSPTITQSTGIVTNFNSSNNINIPQFNFTNKFELYAKIHCTTHASKFWFSSLLSGSNCPGIGTNSNGYMRFYNGSNYEVGYFNLNTWYWVYFVQENSTSKLYYIQDNGYELDILPNINQWSIGPSIGSNLFSSSYGFKIGTNTNYSNEYWSGSVDLSGFLIKADGQIVWKPFVKETRIEETVVPIPGMLDSSVTTDDWQQNQDYKLYQLKNQNNTNTLQLTINNVTDTEQKYKQYVQQLTIPARTYKWYYNGIPEESYPSYRAEGEVVISNGVASNFGESSFIEFNVYPRYYEESVESFTTIIEFETGNSVTNHSLLELMNWHYNPTLDTYTDEMIYFSCIHNGKFSTTDDRTLTTFNDGTTLSPNTKYWMALYLTDGNVRTYLIPDNNYTPETLPSLSLWTLENTITFSEAMNIYYNEWFFGYYSDFSGENVQYNAFNGKLFVDNMLAFNGLTLDPANVIWEPYYYYNSVYRWYANKSLYTYTENQNYADTLDFSDSWLNVTSNWKTQKQYMNPNVCLMPIDGGETITKYVNNGTLVGTTVFSEFSGTITNFSDGSFLQLGTIPFSTANSWEFQVKITTGRILSSTHQNIIVEHNANYNTQLVISPAGIVYFQGSRNHTSYEFSIGSTTILSPNTDYIVTGKFTGTRYELYINGVLENYIDYSTKMSDWVWDIGAGVSGTYSFPFDGIVDLKQTFIKINDSFYWNGINNSSTKNNSYLLNETILQGCLYNYNDDGQQHNFDVYYDSNYTQPILVSSGQSYSAGTKVDTITIPAHRTWAYTTGGNWSKITYVDTSYSNYTYTDGNLVLTEYTGSDTDVIVPNAVI